MQKHEKKCKIKQLFNKIDNSEIDETFGNIYLLQEREFVNHNK